MAVPGIISTTSMKMIETVVAFDYGLDPELLKTVSRKREIVTPRHICMYLGRKLHDLILEKKKEVHYGDLHYLTFKAIGARYGKDHATALNGCRVVSNLIETDHFFAARLESIIFKIGGILCQELSEKSKDYEKKKE